MKYIIIQIQFCLVPVIFSDLIDHSTFLECWCKSSIVSAGFFKFWSYPEKCSYRYVEVYGSSIILKTKSRPEDRLVLEVFLNKRKDKSCG